MKSATKWIIGIIIGLVILLLLFGLLSVGGLWMGGYGGMMRGPGVMRGGIFPMHGIGLGSMFVWLLVPVSCLFLLIFGAVALANLVTRAGNTPPPPATSLTPATQTPLAEARKCTNCGRPTQPDWMTCPYCGQAL